MLGTYNIPSIATGSALLLGNLLPQFAGRAQPYASAQDSVPPYSLPQKDAVPLVRFWPCVNRSDCIIRRAFLKRGTGDGDRMLVREVAERRWSAGR